MPLIGTTATNLKNQSSDRPEYILQNLGSDQVKFDFKQSINFSNDSGFILNSGDSLILNGRLAAASLYAIASTENNRVLIADPGRLS